MPGTGMDHTIAGIFFLVAIIFWLFSAFGYYRAGDRPWGPLLGWFGLAVFAVPFAYNAFDNALW